MTAHSKGPPDQEHSKTAKKCRAVAGAIGSFLTATALRECARWVLEKVRGLAN